MAAESLGESRFMKDMELIISPVRAHVITGKEFAFPARIKPAGFREMLEMAEGIPNRKFIASPDSSPEAKSAIELAKIAEILPALITIPDDGLFRISAADITGFGVSGRKPVKITEAALKLDGISKARIVAFRAGSSGREHLAIIIGEPEKQEAPLTRIHSSCYTGDLLGSLACDCGGQLKASMKAMNEAGGGVLLYLLQEGRGIGLVNKLRAYALQEGGLDTVEANEALGFEDEERGFAPAAAMLLDLGFTRVSLLTNNPKKSAALENLGVKVKTMVPLRPNPTPHNKNYLDTKARKSGHLLNE